MPSVQTLAVHGGCQTAICGGRGMGSPIPSAQEGAWTARVPRLLSEGVVASPVDLFDLEP